MANKHQRYANAVRLQYLQYEERKRNTKTNDYLRHAPDYLTVIPQYTTNMAMLLHDTEENELIYAMRGLDFELIKRNIPQLAIGMEGARRVGGAIGGKVGELTGVGGQRTGQLLGSMAGSYVFGNEQVRTALDILLGGAFNQKIELDENTQQVKESLTRSFINDYETDLNREIINIRDIQARFPNTKVVLAGHSRGAAKARDLAKMLDLEAHLYNPAEASVYGNLFLQIVMPMLFSGERKRTRGALRNQMEFNYDESVNEIKSKLGKELDETPITLSPTGKTKFRSPIKPLGSETSTIFDVNDPQRLPGVERINIEMLEEGLSPAKILRSKSLMEDYVKDNYPNFQADIFLPFPKFSQFLMSDRFDFGSFGYATESESEVIRTAVGMSNRGISMQSIMESAARFASLRYGKGLLKYTLESISDATPSLMNPFQMVAYGSLIENIVNPKEKVVEDNPAIHIHRTANDLISRGYSDIYNEKTKPNVERSPISLIIGDHSLDHFISDSMLNSIQTPQLKGTQRQTQVPSPTPTPVPSPFKSSPTAVPVPKPLPQTTPFETGIPQPIPQPAPENIFVNLGAPRFRELDPYLLCLENPNLPGCSELFNV